METCFPSNVVYPHHCQGTECTMGLSWRDHTDWVEFNLTAKTQGRSVWVALGLSENGEMVCGESKMRGARLCDIIMICTLF